MSLHQLLILLGSVLLLGMRHGIDHDHIAAITDLTALQRAPRRAMRLGVIYATGHGLVLLALGAGAVVIGLQLPAGWEVWREKIVGATLIALGLSVVASMFARVRSPQQAYRMPTRAGMMIAAWRRIVRWAGRLYDPKSATHESMHARAPRHAHAGPDAQMPAFVTGVIHGLGAETPSQLLLLVVAAGMGAAPGLLCVGAFVVGLFITNTVMCAVMVGLYGRETVRHRLTLMVSGVSAVYSLSVGVLYLLGAGTLLPNLG